MSLVWNFWILILHGSSQTFHLYSNHKGIAWIYEFMLLKLCLSREVHRQNNSRRICGSPLHVDFRVSTQRLCSDPAFRRGAQILGLVLFIAWSEKSRPPVGRDYNQHGDMQDAGWVAGCGMSAQGGGSSSLFPAAQGGSELWVQP